MNQINMKALLGVVLLLSVALLGNSCKRGPAIKDQPQVILNKAILKAKAHVESILQEQGSDSFVRIMGFEMNWERAIIDSANNIRVPVYFNLSKLKPKNSKQIAPAKTKEVFELYIKNVSGHTEVSIMQFINIGGKYHALRYTLHGELKTKLNNSIFKKDTLALGGNGKKILSSAFNKKMIYESEFIGLIQMTYGSGYAAVIPYECPLGFWFDPISCTCDYSENVTSGAFYPELFLMIIDGSSNFQYVPYPYSFHPSSILPDPEYPEDPMENVDCAGVSGGTAYVADCGCIGGTTGISDCGQLGMVRAIMFPIASTVKPGAKIILTATILTSGTVTITDKDFEAYYNGAWIEDSIKFSTETNEGSTYTINNAEINVLGDLRYRLKITYTVNGVPSTVYSNEVSTYSRYTSAELSSEFSTQMTSCWSQTVASTTANPGTKFEYGFSVMYNAGTRKVVLDGAIDSKSVICDTLAFGVGLDEVILPGTINPYNGYNFTVGNFHTHPPLTYCPSTHSLVPGPSSIDLSYTTKYPRIVRTYTNTVSGGHNINLALTDHLTHSKTVTDY